jgi:hypothetical protein
MRARLPHFPDSPQGMALALAYLVAQSKGKRSDEPAPDMIALYKKCLEAVIGSEFMELTTRH